MAQPDGVLVLHRELAPDAGWWRVARVDLDGSSQWDVALPITDIEQLWQTDGAVLMVGPMRLSADGPSDPHQWLVALDVRDGTIRTTDLESDAHATR